VSVHLRCPICGRPLHRVAGLEYAIPHSRGRDCPEHHAITTPPDQWEQARLRDYVAEIDAFLHPTDEVRCPGHEWAVIELNSVIAVMECRHCAAMSPIDVRGER
jgi:hypothetical protein